MLNKFLDRKKLAEGFAIDNRLRISDILDPDYAEQIAICLENETPFATFFAVQGNNGILTQQEYAALDRQQQTDLQQALMQDAMQGNGFCYNGHKIHEGENETLKSFLAFLNSEDILQFFREITSDAELNLADGQATQYAPGHYLTRHLDDMENRHFAYVFGFSRAWHPDWGGLLQFFEEDGTPRDAWLPAFNTLSLFSVRHVHSVTCVAPFAGGRRNSITGWFRSA